jgi:hypothetical protein
MNTLALDRLGITSALPDVVDNVRIEKDAAGQPTGRLYGSVTNYYSDSPFMNGLLRQLPLLQPEDVAAGTERAMRAATAMGVTTVYEGHLMVFELIEFYRWLRAENRLTLCVLCSPEAEPFGVPWAEKSLEMEDYLQRLARARDLVDRTDDLFRVDGVTVSRYGPCGPGFTLMREPYKGPYGQDTTGRSFVSPEKIKQAMSFCRENGLRPNIVTAGLAENDTHLEQLESLGQAPLAPDGRAWLLQNVYFTEPDQVRRFAALGMDVTTTMSFSWGKVSWSANASVTTCYPISFRSPDCWTAACTWAAAPTGAPRTSSSTSPWPSSLTTPPADGRPPRPGSVASKRSTCGRARPPTSCAGRASARWSPVTTPISSSSTVTRCVAPSKISRAPRSSPRCSPARPSPAPTSLKVNAGDDLHSPSASPRAGPGNPVSARRPTLELLRTAWSTSPFARPPTGPPAPSPDHRHRRDVLA